MKSQRKTWVLVFIFTVSLILSGCGKPNVQALKSENDITGLINALGYDKGDAESYDNDIRSDAYDALLEIGKPAVDALINAINNNNETIRDSAIRLLGEIKDERAIEPLATALGNEELKSNALYSICRIGSVEAIDILSNYMNEDIVLKGGLVEINVNYVESVCSGQGIEATPYQSQEPGIHPVIIVDERPFESFRAYGYEDDPLNWNEYLPLDWQALGSPQEIELVLCWGDAEEIVIESATYGTNDPVYGTRAQEKKTVILREAVTGNVIAQADLLGEEPDALPGGVYVTEDFKYVGGVTPDILIEWLRPYVEITQN